MRPQEQKIRKGVFIGKVRNGSVRLYFKGHAAGNNDPVAKQKGFCGAVGDDKDGFAGSFFADKFQNACRGFYIESAQRFIKKEHISAKGKGSCNGKAAFHSSGKFIRVFIRAVCKTDFFKIFGGTVFFYVHSSKIFKGRKPGKKPVLLKN